MKNWTIGLGLALASIAAAQDTETTTPPVSTAVPPQVTVSKDLSGVLSAPRKATGAFEVKFSIKNVRGDKLDFEAARNNAQDCAFAPLVRVLEVGTREVVYPVHGEPKMCSQEMETRSAGSQETVTFSRKLDLPAGDYMIENWYTGLVNGELLKIPGTPVRVTVVKK